MLPIDLQELLVLVDLHCNRVVEKEVLYDASSYFREIEKERVQEIRCLGCSQFFQKNTNICDGTITKAPLKVYGSV